MSVFGGHDCTFVPYDRWACDHSRTDLPRRVPGSSLHRLAVRSIRGEGNIWRIVSAADGNEVTFTPAAAHAPMTLGHGEHREFESNDDFLVTGTGPLLLVQYFVGEGDDMASIGDPSMGLAVPIEQYRTDYNFLSPEDYRDEGPRQVGQNWINVVVPDGSTAFLDGVEYADYAAIGSTGYGVARIQVGGGSHTINSPDKVGIICYGSRNYVGLYLADSTSTRSAPRHLLIPQRVVVVVVVVGEPMISPPSDAPLSACRSPTGLPAAASAGGDASVHELVALGPG